MHHETKYRYIREERPDLKKYLIRKRFRRKTKKQRTFHPNIPNRTDISKRPEKAFVYAALERNNWNVTKAAEETGMLRPNFQALLKKLGISVKDHT